MRTLSAQLVQTYAQNEQNFNAVERVLHYTKLPPEGTTVTSNDPPSSWPERGEVKFNNVKLAYREGLPLVLKGVSFTIKPGEKVRPLHSTFASQLTFYRLELLAGPALVSLRSGQN